MATQIQLPPGHHTIMGTDIRLQNSQVIKRGDSDTPYFKLWVNSKAFQADQLVYIDTSEQRMLYNPITYSGSYKTNLSIVMVMKREQSGVYTLSSVVLPNNDLMPTGSIKSTPVSTIYDANFQMGASTKFTFIHRLIDTKTFAIYTEIDDDPKQRAYLLPQVDDTQTGQRQYVIRAVQTKDQDPKGKYLFSTSVCKFPGLG
ncbi:uncharacterized protein LOC135336199 [Halichondria panicea]|uniref:uncharacterized protein LOC135336199 n=1 Tax=Halichondria panicea TaxID=6063 RepID=UPI00312B44F7